MVVKKCVSNILDSNTFLLFQKDECLIVDAGVDVETLKREIGDKKVVGVLLTHGHFDHTYFSEKYKEEFGCPIYISKDALGVAMDKQLNYGDVFFVNNKDYFSVFNEDTEFECKSFKIKAFLTPGHSKGSVCYLIGKDLFAGDTVFKTGIGRYDLVDSDRSEILDSLKKIQGIDFKILHSGHGEDSTILQQERNLNAYIKYLSR